MIRMTRRWLATGVLAVAVFATSGCVAIGRGSSPSGRATLLRAEVRSVDTRSQRIQLREEARRGRNWTVLYDGRTRVVYGQRAYPVSSLERGDRVDVHVVYDRDGRAYANRVDVRQNVRARARVVRIDGTVAWVDAHRGSFGLAPRSGQGYAVYVPRTLSRSELNRFGRIRRGDRVRAEVRVVSRDGYELVRFR